MGKKNDSLTAVKERNVLIRRILILFVIWAMAVALLATLAGTSQNDVARIVLGVSIGVFTVVYIVVFVIIFRREKQKKGNK